MNWSGRRVLLTGHTGFKGSWQSLWLQQLGAEVCGFSLEPLSPSLFQDAAVGSGMRSVIGDIRDIEMLRHIFSEFKPEIVFHLAAQSLVRRSYEDPLGTYSTNVMGTANVLEAARSSESVRAIVVVTTDKCYENQEWDWPYRETDTLGGYDPYSNSKACAELVVSAYRNSYFNIAQFDQHGVGIASVRAGNVIGGGDWAEARLVPDTLRAFQEKRPVFIRNPLATRPWQHVLEPLRGYLMVAESLFDHGPSKGEAWNFGPEQADVQPVEWIVRELAGAWGEQAQWIIDEIPQPHEAHHLKLDWSKAEARLGWRPLLRLKEALAITADWYRARAGGQEMYPFTLGQISDYAARSQTSKPNVVQHSGVEV